MVEEVIGHEDNSFVPGAPNHGITQPNDPSQQAQNPVIPPLSYPDKPRDPNDPYDYITTDVPSEQPIIIYLNHAQAGYLPHASTSDENKHLVPQNVYNPRTRERVFPIAIIRQGEAGGVRFRFKVLSPQGRVDLSDFYMIRFQGHDYQNHFMSSDVGFDTTQMSLGEFTWEPEEALALTSGKYVSAQIVLEKQDRTQRSISLDFDLHIIPNDVAFPRPMAFYISEYQRALFHIKEMQDLADRHIGYTIDFFDNVVTDSLALAHQKIDTALKDFENKLTDENKKLTDLDNNLTDVKKVYKDFKTALGDKLADLTKQMDQKNLVTADKLIQMFKDAVTAGDLTTEDEIQDEQVAQIIEAWDAGSTDVIPAAQNFDVSNLSADSVTITGDDNG